MKTNYISIFFVSLFLLLTGGAHSQTAYYYAFDEKIFLDVVEDKMIVSFQDNITVDVKALLGSDKTEWLNDSICIVNAERTPKEVFTKNLLQVKGLKSVYPMYVTKDGVEMGVTDEIVMRFNQDVSPRQIEEIHKKYSVNVVKKTELYWLVTVPKNANVLEIANQYQLSGLVKYSHPNFIAKTEKLQTIPDDPYFINQFYLHNTGQIMPNGHSGSIGADINAPEAWDITKGNSDIVIAVLDEGITSDHPDLPNYRQVRLNGSNFANGNVNDPSPAGNDNHGNSCAGIIAASHNNEGVAGIAPNCKIMPVRLLLGLTPTSGCADAITFAKNRGADILSNSWAYSSTNPNSYPVIVDAIEDAVLTGRDGKGCIVVFGAGNLANHVLGHNGFVCFPSNVNIAGVLTVGASDRYDQQANYSPTSDSNGYDNQIIDIVAPSHRAYSHQISTETFEAWTIDIPGNTGDNPVKRIDHEFGVLPVIGSYLPDSGIDYLAYTGHFGGTSCACPQVAGVAALILSLNPDLTQQEVYNVITSTARKAEGYIYQTTSGIFDGTWNFQMGHGVLDAYAAVNKVTCTVNLTDQTVTSDTYVTSCGDINVENVKVRNGAKLTLDAAGEVNIICNFEVDSGSEFEIE